MCDRPTFMARQNSSDLDTRGSASCELVDRRRLGHGHVVEDPERPEDHRGEQQPAEVELGPADGLEEDEVARSLQLGELGERVEGDGQQRGEGEADERARRGRDRRRAAALGQRGAWRS